MARLSAAEVLFSRTQQRLLRALFAMSVGPEGLPYSELLRITSAGAGGIHRELQQFVRAGLVRERLVGARRFYLPNEAHPVYPELRTIARKLLGIPSMLQEALAPFSDQIVQAFVFGSIAKNTDDARSDVDLMIVGTCPMGPVLEVLQELEPKLGRKISARFFDPEEYRRKVDSDPFLSRVLSGPRIGLLEATSAPDKAAHARPARKRRS